MTFKDLHVVEPILEALAKEGYETPTPIQLQSIPPLLEGKDLMGIAQTGTGKTAAFVIPILQAIHQKRKVPYPKKPHVLVLAPTRELAAQIGKSFTTYGRFLRFEITVIFGGVNQHHQVKAMQKGVDVLVATPGRLIDLMQQGYINLQDVEYFVLDEADRMLDMGFIRDIRRIISMLPQHRQSSFFSATMSKEINELAKSLLRNPVHVQVTPQATTVELIDQKVYFVNTSNKDALLVHLINEQNMRSVLVFTRTKSRANKVMAMLNKYGVTADAIHGNKSQGYRTKALNSFKSRDIQVLVATDIAARGIDIEGISHVINYDIPYEPESYVHRIGRTARAGASGAAYSFCSGEERKLWIQIERLIKKQVTHVKNKFHSEPAMNGVSNTPLDNKNKSHHHNKPHGPKRHFRRH